MSAQIQERVTLPTFVDPVLITAFTTPNKGGATASWAMGNLMSECNAQLVAELDAAECYNYGRMRPKFERRDNGAEIEWPTNLIYAATPEGSDRTFLFLVGVEPTHNWQCFAEAVAAFARRAGVRTAVSLRSTPGWVSHRETAPVFAIYSNEEQRARFGTPILPMHEGAADIGMAINIALRAAGCDVVDLFVVEPFYTPGMPCASAAVVMLDTLRHAFRVSYDGHALEDVARAQDQTFDQLLSSSPELRESVEAIESRAGRRLSDVGFPLSTPQHVALDRSEPPVDQVVNEVENFLRAQRS